MFSLWKRWGTVLKLKEIAKIKAKQEKKRLEAELELLLVVEKLQELRSIRIQKLKKQGHFLPKEDDKFLERVQAAVEEEEHKALVSIEIDATKDAIATAEESRKAIQIQVKLSKGSNDDRESCGEANNPVANLPIEFYHYYHGSNNDMGALIEVRRGWDAYIRPGGSRISGHWFQPSPPANEIWASYLNPHDLPNIASKNLKPVKQLRTLILGYITYALPDELNLVEHSNGPLFMTSWWKSQCYGNLSLSWGELYFTKWRSNLGSEMM
ncbi:hypothetical protein VNO77_15400 [Canavalia gladiata]|uniref:Uncharacterized protein n=1 Tax=Canavalia gladiata TaxID=3824 RepID=A0AAN9QP69_CANGL